MADAPLEGTELHPHAAAVLGAALPPQGRPSHAYLFGGPAGAGKRTVARAFAAALLAEGAPDPEAVAGRVERGSHPDLTWVTPSGAHELLVGDVDTAVVGAPALRPRRAERGDGRAPLPRAACAGPRAGRRRGRRARRAPRRGDRADGKARPPPRRDGARRAVPASRAPRPHRDARPPARARGTVVPRCAVRRARRRRPGRQRRPRGRAGGGRGRPRPRRAAPRAGARGPHAPAPPAP